MNISTGKLQLAVFALVTAAFTNIYLPQPILPVLQKEFGVTPVQVSMMVSVVILGIVVSNLFFGYLSDKVGIHPILAAGGVFVAAGGVLCASTHSFSLLIACRFVQGLFIPALTTSLAAWLARSLPPQRLAVVMGSYVSATVLGGLGGRLLGGWIHPPLHWRYAFLSAAVFIFATMLLAVAVLPRSSGKTYSRTVDRGEGRTGYLSLLARRELLLIFGCGAGGLMIYSPIFNYLPYRLAAAPFGFSTEMITMVYFVYLLGIFMGPFAGRLSNRFGGGAMLVTGALLLGLSLALLLTPYLAAVVLGLLGVCAGFFTIHAVAVGMLNRKVREGHGRANALYVLWYYAGGWLGITGAGFAYEYAGWDGVVGFAMLCLVIPVSAGILEKKEESRAVDIGPIPHS